MKNTLYLLNGKVLADIHNRKQLLQFLTDAYAPGDVAKIQIVTVQERLVCTFKSQVILGVDHGK